MLAKLPQTSAASLNDVGMKFADSFSKLDEKTGIEATRHFFIFAQGLHESMRLSRALTDYSKDKSGKQKIVKELTKSVKSPKIVTDVVSELSTKKWSKPRDLFAATAEFGFSSLMISLSKAKDSKALENVEADLFKFEEQLKDIAKVNDDIIRLRDVLSSESKSLQARFEIIEHLIGKKASTPTLFLAKYATMQIRGNDRYVDALKSIADEIARTRGKKVVDVISAVPLTVDQVKNLESALVTRHQCQVQINIAVKPAMLGGLRIEVDGQVFDNTVLNSVSLMVANFEQEYGA